MLDIVCGQIGQPPRTENLASDASAPADSPHGSSAAGSAAWNSSPEKIRPILKGELLAPAHDLQRAIVAGMETSHAASVALRPSLRYALIPVGAAPLWSR